MFRKILKKSKKSKIKGNHYAFGLGGFLGCSFPSRKGKGIKACKCDIGI